MSKVEGIGHAERNAINGERSELHWIACQIKRVSGDRREVCTDGRSNSRSDGRPGIIAAIPLETHAIVPVASYHVKLPMRHQVVPLPSEVIFSDVGDTVGRASARNRLPDTLRDMNHCARDIWRKVS